MIRWPWRRNGSGGRAPQAPALDVDHAAERAAAIDARRWSQRALDDALRSREATSAVAANLRRHRTENRFAERIRESFRE